MKNQTITTLMHMENMVLGIAFGTAVSVLKNEHIAGYKGTYNHIKLEDIEDGEPKDFPVKGNRFAQVSSDNFEKIPGAPVAYWVSEKLIETFEKGDMLKDIAAPKKGLDTADNERFIRCWHEINIEKACFFSNSHEEAKRSQKKWFPLNSGGNFRKWYGNFEKVINWENDGQEICNYPKAYVRARNYYFREGLSWTKISSSKLGVRYAPRGFIFDSAGQTVFADKENEMYILGLWRY